MANRSYLYASNFNPDADRESPHLEGVSEWSYALPLSYEILVSGDPQICRSIISNGVEVNDDGDTSPVYAVYSESETGKRRLLKLLEILKFSASQERKPSTFRRLVSPFGFPFKGGPVSPLLLEAIEKTQEFMNSVSHPFFLLETIELDVMSTGDPKELRKMVDTWKQRSVSIGAEIDALPSDAEQALGVLAISNKDDSHNGNALMNLRIDDHFDKPRPGENYLGLSYWSDVLAIDFSPE